MFNFFVFLFSSLKVNLIYRLSERNDLWESQVLKTKKLFKLHYGILWWNRNSQSFVFICTETGNLLWRQLSEFHQDENTNAFSVTFPVLPINLSFLIFIGNFVLKEYSQGNCPLLRNPRFAKMALPFWATCIAHNGWQYENVGHFGTLIFQFTTLFNYC